MTDGTPPSTPARTFSVRYWAGEIKKLGPAAILGAAWALFPAVLGGTLLIYLASVSEWLQSLGAWGWAMYALVFVVSAGVGFLPTYGQSFLGGWTFGFWSGFGGAMVGFVGGSLVGYFIAQFVSRERIEQALKSHPKGEAVRDALLRHGFWRAAAIIALVRLPPNSPFALTNLVLASSGAKLGPYLLGTAVGMAPRTAVAVWIASRGAATGAQDIQQFVSEQPWWVLPATIAMTVVIFTIIGRIASHAMKSMTERGPHANAVVAAPMTRPPEDAAA